MASAEEPSQVQIVWDDGHGHAGVPAAPQGNDYGDNRGQALLALAALTALIGGLWFAARPDAGFSAANERIVTPTTTVAESPASSVASTAAPAAVGEVEAGDDSLALGGPLRQPVPVTDGWRALRETAFGTELVQSADGLVWASTGAGLPPGDVLAMSASGDELVAVIISYPDQEEGSNDQSSGYEAQLWRSSDAGLLWFPDQTAPSLRSDGNIYRGTVASSAAVVETAESVRADQPAEIRDVLSTFVSESEAQEVCTIRSVFEQNEPGYSLQRCDGSAVLTLTESEIFAGTSTASFGISECLELLGFAMRSQGRISVVQPGEDAFTLELPPFTFASDVIPTDEGLLAVLVDYRYFSPLVGPCLPLRDNISSGVYRWSGGEFEREDSLPAHNLVDYFGATLTPVGNDGSILLAASEGGFVLEPGGTEWLKMIDRPVGGGTMDASADGSTLMYRNRNDEIWLTRSDPWRDGEGSWQKMEPTDSTFATLLLGNDEGAVLAVENLLGVELIQVPLG